MAIKSFISFCFWSIKKKKTKTKMSYRNIYMLQHFVYMSKKKENKKESRLLANTMGSCRCITSHYRMSTGFNCEDETIYCSLISANFIFMSFFFWTASFISWLHKRNQITAQRRCKRRSCMCSKLQHTKKCVHLMATNKYFSTFIGVFVAVLII